MPATGINMRKRKVASRRKREVHDWHQPSATALAMSKGVTTNFAALAVAVPWDWPAIAATVGASLAQRLLPASLNTRCRSDR